MSAPVYVHLTRRGFLAAQLLRAADQNADYDAIEQAVERIAARGECHAQAERDLLLLANLGFESPDKTFPDGGRSS